MLNNTLNEDVEGITAVPIHILLQEKSLFGMSESIVNWALELLNSCTSIVLKIQPPQPSPPPCPRKAPLK